jgi:ABC-2 type transport system ATP-binding protein
MNPTDALCLRGLSKTFARPAVMDLNLSIRAGEFYGLLGPNGAGKSTTLRMVVGLLKPDAGSIEVFGIDALADPIAAKQMIAWVPDEPLLYDKLTPLEYLAFVSGLWRVAPVLAERRAKELLERLGLWENRNERCEGFSRGMKQKAALAGALLHDPKLLSEVAGHLQVWRDRMKKPRAACGAMRGIGWAAVPDLGTPERPACATYA